MPPQLLLSILLLLGFFVLVIRPQRARLRGQRALMDALQSGDRIMTTSGFFGVIREVQTDRVLLSLSPTVTVWVVRGAISRRLSSEDAGPSIAELTGTTVGRARELAPPETHQTTAGGSGSQEPGDGDADAPREDDRP